MYQKVLGRFLSQQVAFISQQKLKMEKIVKLCDLLKDKWQEAVSSACQQLKNNKIIAVPTDTIYGIAGLAQSTEAVNRIYDIKGRASAKPVSICVGDVRDIPRWGQVTISSALLNELLPGPVTVVFERTLNLNPELNPGTTLVGIRVPNHGFVRDVSRMCEEPLALTSANPSAAGSTLSIQEFETLWAHLEGVYDGGVLGCTEQSRLGSTVVDLSKVGRYTIIRPGSASVDTIAKLEKYGLTEEPKP